MATKNRQSMLQKRNKKLMKRKRKLARRPQQSAPAVTPYFGNVYRTAEFVRTIMETETAIHEADVIESGSLTDRDVIEALGDLIVRMRHGELDELLSDDCSVKLDIVGTMIRLKWNHFFSLRPRHSIDSLIGILRTIIASVETRGATHSSDRGYLTFIGKWLHEKFGVEVRAVLESDVVEELGGNEDSDTRRLAIPD